MKQKLVKETEKQLLELSAGQLGLLRRLNGAAVACYNAALALRSEALEEGRTLTSPHISREDLAELAGGEAANLLPESVLYNLLQHQGYRVYSRRDWAPRRPTLIWPLRWEAVDILVSGREILLEAGARFLRVPLSALELEQGIILRVEIGQDFDSGALHYTVKYARATPARSKKYPQCLYG